MFQDTRHAFRMMLRNKAWTAVVVLSLAIGIGANTALFSVRDAKLFRKLSVNNPDELVLFSWISREWRPADISGDSAQGPWGMKSTSFSAAALEQFRNNGETLSDVFAFTIPRRGSVVIDGQADRVTAQGVSGNYFAALGVPAFPGRTIRSDDDRPFADRVTVISDRFWERRFGRDLTAIGQVAILNGVALTIVGVTPPEFRGTVAASDFAPDFSIPLAFQPHERQGARIGQNTWWLQIAGRMKPGVTIEQVNGNLAGVFRGAAVAESPDDVPGLDLTSGSRGMHLIRQDLRARIEGILLWVFAVLLLIVCLNVANLLVARAATRQYEIGVRVAMGAGRLRLIRQLITESLVLASAAGFSGLLLTYWGKDLLRVFLGQDVELIRLDSHVIAFSAGISLLTGILFGLAPALQSTRTEVSSAVKRNTRYAAGSRSRLGKSLLVAQVAMSVVLMSGAGLLLRTLSNIPRVDVGFDSENLLLFSVESLGPDYDLESQKVNFDQMISDRISAIPGVVGTTAADGPLVGGAGSSPEIHVDGVEAGQVKVGLRSVHANFFEVLGIPVLRGRSLSPRDTRGAPRIAVVNETLVRGLFPSTDPIGKYLKYEDGSAQLEIVGVVQDVNVATVMEAIQATAFVSDLQGIPGESVPRSRTIQVRTAGDPLNLFPAVRTALQEITGTWLLMDVKTQTQQIEDGFAGTRVLLHASSFFGGAALLLTCIGLYGLMSYSVAGRTNEIGIRMALGAQRRDVVQLVMGQTLRLVIVGLVLGTLLSLAGNQVIRTSVFGVTLYDPITLVSVAIVMLSVTGLAAYLPARRASRIDPTVALRCE